MRFHERRARASEAGDAMEVGGLEGFGEGHYRQDRREASRQHTLAGIAVRVFPEMRCPSSSRAGGLLVLQWHLCC
jgi:hypothetical protein